MTRYSKPVPPILIMDAISMDEDMELQEEVVLEHLPEAVLQDIICISGWLVEYGRNQGTAVCLSFPAFLDNFHPGSPSLCVCFPFLIGFTSLDDLFSCFFHYIVTKITQVFFNL